MLETHTVRCPYCGESFDTGVDTSGGSQEYVEDCYVCCRPITFRLSVDADGNVAALEVQRDHD